MVAMIIITFCLWRLYNQQGKQLEQAKVNLEDIMIELDNMSKEIEENKIVEEVTEEEVVDEDDTFLCDKVEYPEYLWKCMRKDMDYRSLWMTIKCEDLLVYNPTEDNNNWSNTIDNWHYAYQVIYSNVSDQHSWDIRYLERDYIMKNCKSLYFK